MKTLTELILEAQSTLDKIAGHDDFAQLLELVCFYLLDDQIVNHTLTKN